MNAFNNRFSLVKPFFVIFILTFIICSGNYPENKTLKEHNEIDKLLILSDSLIQIDFEKSLKFSKIALSKAEILNDSKRKAMSYYYISRSLIFFRDFDQCYSYLEKGLHEEALQKDKLLEAAFLNLQARYYSRMSLAELSYHKNLETLKILEANNSVESQLLKSEAYLGIADFYTDKKMYHLANKYADKSILLFQNISLKQYLEAKRIYRNRPFAYFHKSWILLDEKKTHLAYYYIQEAYKQAMLDNFSYMAPFYELYGDYYYQSQDFKTAIGYYMKAVENKKKFKQNSAYVDSKISNSYRILGDKQREINFLQKAERQREKDLRADRDILQKELNRILKKKNNEKLAAETRSKFINFIITITFIFLLVIIVMYFFNVKKRKQKTIKEQTSKLSTNEFQIKNMDEVIRKLQHMTYEGQSELIEMFKINSPQFWIRFQAIYPDFLLKMLDTNPKLKISELTFCAQIYLGFTTKEIAKYTNRAPKTIENNRYNLRKRLKLSPEEDITVWIRNYIDKSN